MKKESSEIKKVQIIIVHNKCNIWYTVIYDKQYTLNTTLVKNQAIEDFKLNAIFTLAYRLIKYV